MVTVNLLFTVSHEPQSYLHTPRHRIALAIDYSFMLGFYLTVIQL